MRAAPAILASLALGFSAPARASESADLAKQAKQVLTTYCYRCHGQNGSNEGGFGQVLAFPKLGNKIVPGDPAKSRLFKRVGIKRDMPPEDERPRPGDTEIAVLEKWIKAGAPAPPEETVKPRLFVSLQDELEAMRQYLRRAERDNRRFLRFFSLRHLHNLPPDKVRDADLRIYRAALSKLVNSLSRKKDIVVPDKVNGVETLFAIDLRKLDWDRQNLWNEILRAYPYGLSHDQYPDDRTIRDLAEEVVALSGSPLPVIRADWFITTAAQPPLYHVLLQLPVNARDLERELEVDVARNFVNANKVNRAGFTASGVSSHNRLLERHDAKFGAYWKSYDFKRGTGLGNLFVFPLGPRFAGHPHPRNAFQHAGGEIIWNLANGLQGYLLVNAKDERINEGPVEIVSDSKKVSGTPAIVNGLSCMACHQEGIIPFQDQVRAGNILGGDARKLVNKLYPEAAEMNRLIERDRRQFLTALEEATGPFLKVGEEASKPIGDFPEPISAIARWYLHQELTLEEAARELGLSDPKVLQAAVQANPRLQMIGLFPLAKGNTIKREVWEDTAFLLSPFQEAARELNLGTPLRQR